ncbi:hypothetical protein NQ318_006790 [Aromia moschata]|uniref:Dynein assembly factor 3, axonemal n=1 Tax=Aromia moschata TaxID=1265417 RepID=A0AAV8XRY6_9CUCU|nr:hypothetical protein NQ318_006790 [Aromia moschata]
MFWGLTPSLDLLEEYESIKGNLPEELNILIIGGSDCRHVLLTEARKYRHAKTKINFYLVDGCVESIARQLLLLNVALQPQEALGLDQKTKIFMELYGNTLVRPSAAKYLFVTASDLVKMVTDYDYLKLNMNFVNIDIKYKERDYLENILKFWCSQDDFNICQCWDNRLRKTLGVRYDSKLGVFDWDLHMRFHAIGGRQVCGHEYKNFRLNGVAFTWLESEVSKPNRSLVCAAFPNGERYAHYGYLGDMVTGPFVSFGLKCEDESFHKSLNGQNSHRATDVTERNLKQVFHEIQNKTEYEHRPTSDMLLGSAMLRQEKLVVDVKAMNVTKKASRKCVELEDTVNFLSLSILDVMKYKDKYRSLFDLVYFGNGYLKYMDRELIKNVSKEGSLIFIEHQIFILSNRDKNLDEFEKEIDDKLEWLKGEKLSFDAHKDCYVKFIVKQK